MHTFAYFAPLVDPVDVPPGRGLWRVTLHDRRWSAAQSVQMMEIAELLDARSRRLEMAMNTPALFTFAVPGASPTTLRLKEMTTEVCLWRYNAETRGDDLLFAGIVTATHDTISENVHTVSVTVQDYSAMMKRRYITREIGTTTPTDQDILVDNFVALSSYQSSNDGRLFFPGSYVPLAVRRVDPSGAPRGTSGQLRMRTFTLGSQIYTLNEQLSECIGGYDWGVTPMGSGGQDSFDCYYPRRGVPRQVPLVWGWNLSTVDRYSSSAEFANYQLLTGDAPAEGAPVPLAEAYTNDASQGAPGYPGCFADAGSEADVILVDTLRERVNGLLDRSGQIVPSYTLGLRPGALTELRDADADLGDLVPLVIHSGRLNVDTQVRILSVDIDITDEGNENVSIGCGRPDTTLADYFTGADRRLAALERR